MEGGNGNDSGSKRNEPSSKAPTRHIQHSAEVVSLWQRSPLSQPRAVAEISVQLPKLGLWGRKDGPEVGYNGYERLRKRLQPEGRAIQYCCCWHGFCSGSRHPHCIPYLLMASKHHSAPIPGQSLAATQLPFELTIASGHCSGVRPRPKGRPSRAMSATGCSSVSCMACGRQQAGMVRHPASWAIQTAV